MKKPVWIIILILTISMVLSLFSGCRRQANAPGITPAETEDAESAETEDEKMAEGIHAPAERSPGHGLPGLIPSHRAGGG